MKKAVLITLSICIVLNSQSYALDTPLFDMRNKIFEESKEVKSLLSDSDDFIILSAMFNSCILAVSQMDAYFSMLGILDSIKQEDLSDKPLDHIHDWLLEMKASNGLSIGNLSITTQILEPGTKVYMDKLKRYFIDLNRQIDAEMDKISILKKSVRGRQLKSTKEEDER